MDVGELFGDAMRHLPFLAAGVDEEQILLPIVEKSEIALGVGRLAGCGGGLCGRRLCGDRLQRRSGGRPGFAGSFYHDWTWSLWWVSSHEAMDAIERIGGDAAAVAEPRGELAVIDGPASEGRFGKSGLPTIVGDFLEQLLGVHGTPRPEVSSTRACEFRVL